MARLKLSESVFHRWVVWLGTGYSDLSRLTGLSRSELTDAARGTFARGLRGRPEVLPSIASEFGVPIETLFTMDPLDVPEIAEPAALRMAKRRLAMPVIWRGKGPSQ